MRLGILQPYFFPYIGYFQLLAMAEKLVIYDNIKFVKSGWIHRNRILVNGQPAWLTLPLRKASDGLNIRDRYLAEDFSAQKGKMLRRIAGAYQGAPHFQAGMAVVEEALSYSSDNLFDFLWHALTVTCRALAIDTGKLVVSSTVPIDHGLRAQDKVIALCHAMGTEHYVNPPGGRQLYDRQDFGSAGIRLSFLMPHLIQYPQFGLPFRPALSILDLAMFIGWPETRRQLSNFTLD